MRHLLLFLFLSVLALPAAACGQAQPQAAQPGAAPTLAEARAGFATTLVEKTRDGTRLPRPPAGVLDIVQYPGPLGQMAGYLTPAPKAPGKHPAIIWISGGDSNAIGDFWSRRDPENDQTAAAFREAGVVTFYPALRGGNTNPGFREGFYGEVDDVLAAADWLAKQDWVDPERIYLGGHSTGGTMAMLVDEASDRFRAVFAFGPVADVRNYGGPFVYADPKDAREMKLRSPGYWLASAHRPLHVFEGTGEGNIEELEMMRKISRNPAIHFYGVAGHSHFSILAAVTPLIARKIVAEAAQGTPIGFTQAELDGAGK